MSGGRLTTTVVTTSVGRKGAVFRQRQSGGGEPVALRK